jgi:hypothetical protein
MKSAKHILTWFFVLLVFCWSMNAQQRSLTGSATVPRLVNFSGKATDAQGKLIVGIVGATFAIYKEEAGGSPLWFETQNLQADAKGNYTVQLGASKPDGLPLEVFSSGEARWLGVTVNGGQEQPRVLLLSVPYALKAADAETIGGLPPSAFALVAPANGAGTGATSSRATASSSASGVPPASSNVTTTGGTVNAVPLWTTATNVQSSAISQTGTGTTAKIGIGTTTPGVTLDVKGAETVRGALTLPAAGTATATNGANSQPQDLVASSFSSSTSTAVNQKFQWQAEPAANNTANPSGTLNLLYGLGATAASETGLKLSPTGLITFAAGQTFPGTVNSVGLTAPASDFTVTGSPVTKSGTLKLAWTAAPTNADVANAIVKRDASGNFSAGTITAANLNATNATLSNSISVSSSSGNAISASTSATGFVAVSGFASATTGENWGVAGFTSSNAKNAYGVFGSAESSLGNGTGVYGQASTSTGAGVFGLNGPDPSSTATSVGCCAGVWGDGSTVSGEIGVLGTAGDYYAGYFVNNSPSGYTGLIAGSYSAGSSPFAAYNFSNPNTGAVGCSVDGIGDLLCNGTKNAVVPIDGGKRRVALSAIESPENWFEDFGSAQLINGVAVIRLDPNFIQTVNTEKDYRVFPVPNGDCKGLYVTNKSPNSFEVRELGGGTSNIPFDYRITAIRRKYETVRFADHTNDPDPGKMLEQMHKVKPASFSDPVSVMPVLQPGVGVPGAQLTNK